MRDAAVILALLGACGGGDDGATPADAPPIDTAATPDAPAYVPGAAIAVSAGAAGNDEDPALLRARDGSIYLAWYSHAAGDNVVIARTTDGVTWSPPVHVSASAGINFGPTLYQDAAGTFHAAWFRWAGAPPGKIVYSHSADGVTWRPEDEVDVTQAAATDDWVPSLAANPAGELVVAFARNTCPPPNTCYAIAAARSTTNGATWDAPVTVAAAAGGLEQHLPALANTGGELVIAWDPYTAGAGAPWSNAMTGAHISVIHSATGATWHDAADVTTAEPSSVTLYPTIYTDLAGAFHVAWMSATASTQSVVEVPLTAPASTPEALPLDGYSPRVVATSVPDVYLGAYVAGPTDEREVYTRVFLHAVSF